MRYYVYKITAKDGRSYIGSSIRPQARFEDFLKSRNNLEATLTILSSHRTRTQAHIAEAAAIAHYNTLWPNGFNRTSSGQQRGRVREQPTLAQITKMTSSYWSNHGPVTKPVRMFSVTDEYRAQTITDRHKR